MCTNSFWKLWNMNIFQEMLKQILFSLGHLFVIWQLERRHFGIGRRWGIIMCSKKMSKYWPSLLLLPFSVLHLFRFCSSHTDCFLIWDAQLRGKTETKMLIVVMSVKICKHIYVIWIYISFFKVLTYFSTYTFIYNNLSCYTASVNVVHWKIILFIPVWWIVEDSLLRISAS